MTKRSLVVLVIVMFMLGLLSPAFPQSHSFVYKPLQGQVLKYKVNGNTDQATKFEAYPSQPVQIMLNMEFTVGSDSTRTEGFIPFVMTIDKADVTSRSGVGGANAYANTSILVGQSFNVVLSPQGKVLETSGLELLPRIQVVMEDPRGQNFGDVLKQLFVEIPDRAVLVGETWDQTSMDSTNEGGIVTKTQVKGTYQLKKVGPKDGSTMAEITGKLEIDVVQGGPIMGGEISFNGEGKGKVEYVFDIDNGILISQKTSSLIDGIVTIKGGQSLTGTVTTNSEASFKIEK